MPNFKPFIEGFIAFELFYEMKLKYGVKQTVVADAIGVSRQAITDMKACRRRFTRQMADRLIAKFKPEPWADWLEKKLNDLFGEVKPNFAIPAELRIPFRTPEVSLPPSPRENSFSLPILTALWQGDPEDSLNNTRRLAMLPDDLTAQAADAVHPYIFILDFDSKDGRLRRGDWVLVIQGTDRDSEVMVIEHGEALRLARRGRHHRLLMRTEETDIPDAAWVLLDSDAVIPADNAKKLGCVVGIVMALL